MTKCAFPGNTEVIDFFFLLCFFGGFSVYFWKMMVFSNCSHDHRQNLIFGCVNRYCRLCEVFWTALAALFWELPPLSVSRDISQWLHSWSLGGTADPLRELWAVVNMMDTELWYVAHRKVLAVEPETVLAQEASGWEVWSIIYAHTLCISTGRENCQLEL